MIIINTKRSTFTGIKIGAYSLLKSLFNFDRELLLTWASKYFQSKAYGLFNDLSLVL
jgi:hypothetical protein